MSPRVLAAVLAVVAVSCSTPEPQASGERADAGRVAPWPKPPAPEVRTSEAVTPPETASPAARTEEAAPPAPERPATHGSIVGRVLLAPDAPRPVPVVWSVASDPQAAALFPDGVTDPMSVVGEDGSVDHAVVWLLGVDAADAPPRSPATLTVLPGGLDPPLLAAVEGQEIVVRNRAGGPREIHARPKRNDNWFREVANGAEVSLVYRKKERAIRVLDAYADWRTASLWVLDERALFDVSGDGGTFRIDGVPPGTQRLRADHPRLGRVDAQVDVRPGETTEVELRLPGK